MEIVKKSMRVEMSKVRVKDRISGLPDEVLCHMLSFLPTKYAVRTSILSTRWKNIWASVPNLDFDMEDSSNPDGFTTFVERVLYFRHSSDIPKFRLHCSSVSDFSRMDGWIRTAIKRNAVELDLSVSYKGKKFELPKSLFMCKTLVVLKVNSNCIIYNPPKSGCFPSLKFLHVTAEAPGSDSMEKVFSCCPVLEELTIDVKLGGNEVYNFKVSAPELKKLRMTFRRADRYPTHDEYNVSINAPKLENLDLEQDILSNFFWENVESLVKASVNLYYHEAYEHDEYSNCATALLAGLSNVKSLSLSSHTFLGRELPAFDNLSELKLVLHDCYLWGLLIEVLKRSRSLQYLVIEHKKVEGCVKPVYDERSWRAPTSVPACLISHLETITMRGFKGYPHEKKAAQFLFENGKVLNKMTIHTDLRKEFSTFQRGSKTCQFELD